MINGKQLQNLFNFDQNGSPNFIAENVIVGK